ncbi:glycoside hydrolase family 38 C-terminal domain-containing protein [Streptomyces sp. NPDC008139]|uniref:glycoside hydrolase family 38 C-terminal domain-containing protein n=1 Tax=Streptomyces sp. NPDC008139 TaxID=3364814 RepID=UPI0036E2A0C0
MRRWPANSSTGRRFFAEEFGIPQEGVWLPDSFAGSGPADSGPADSGTGFYNAGPYARREVTVLPAGTPAADGQPLSDGRTAVLVEAPAFGTGQAVRSALPPVSVTEDATGITLDNGVLRIRIDADGLVRSAYDLRAGREAIAPGAAGNLPQLQSDDPHRWSAWNIDGHYRGTVRDLTAADTVEVTEAGPLLASARVTRSFGGPPYGRGAFRSGRRQLTGGRARSTAVVRPAGPVVMSG